MKNATKENVLVLDANQRSALATTRSLGSRDINVTVADTTLNTLAGSSRYCQNREIYTAPQKSVDQFIASIIDIVDRHNIGIIFPMTEITAYLLLEHQAALDHLILPFRDFTSFKSISDKCNLFSIATELGISIPKTIYINNTCELDSLEHNLDYPVVIKPCRSRIFTTTGVIDTSVRYANNFRELVTLVRKTPYLQNFSFMIQEYISGYGQGIFALFNEGKSVCCFAHKRLREKPPTGGVSVLSESVPVPDELNATAQKLLEQFKWHGIAMVEFKISADGTPYLMEINPRFWGSLQLAISAGLDFPYLLYRLVTGDTKFTNDDMNYQNGVKLRWLLGDLDNLLITFKSNQYSLKCKIATFVNFMVFFSKNQQYEINRFDDLKPAFQEAKDYIRNLF